MRAITRFIPRSIGCALLGAALSAAAVAPASAACRDPGMQQAFAQPGYLQPPAPVEIDDFSFTRADGTTGRLSDYRGKPVMLIFWATWCTGCHAEMPDVNAMIGDYDENDIVFLPLSLDANRAQAERYLQMAGYDNIAAHHDPNMSVFSDLCFVATPTHAVLDREGRLKEVFIGAQPWSHHSARTYLDGLIGG